MVIFSLFKGIKIRSLVITHDMQATLSIPASRESILYYKRKLSLYHFTIYDCLGNGLGFLFDETNGTKGCNEVTTSLLMYILQLPITVEEFTGWSDTCSAQNRNFHLLCMLIYAVNTVEHLKIINLKYLESGHTYLECDSMHANIERKKKNAKVYSIGEMRMLIENARVDPTPYTCKIVDFSEILNFKAMSKSIIKNKATNTSGETISWLKIK